MKYIGPNWKKKIKIRDQIEKIKDKIKLKKINKDKGLKGSFYISKL